VERLAQERTSTLNAEQLRRRIEIGEERRARTRAKLFDAAYRLFAVQGADTPTIDDVLVEAGVARGTYYNHFKTRQELFEAVAQDITTSIGDIILSAINDMPDPAERVALAFRMFIRYAVADPARGWILLRTLPLGGALNERMKAFVQSEFESARLAGALRCVSARAATDLAVGMHIMTIQRVLIEGAGDGRIEEAAAELMVAFGVPHAKAMEMAATPLREEASRPRTQRSPA
jgi:AcrR family transcriptional regulator